MVRVSEFTDDVDFLDNHDSATKAALAVLLSRMAKQVNVSAQCLEQLGSLCPGQRGLGESSLSLLPPPSLSLSLSLTAVSLLSQYHLLVGSNCLGCVQNSSSLPGVCGDKEMSDYNTHFFCGEGKPYYITR